MIRTLFPALALLLLSAPLALADTAAALLVVEDVALTERVGVAVFKPFLRESGAYADVRTLTGDLGKTSEEVGRAIRELAARHDQIDVFLSVHTIRRRAHRLRQLIPPAAARKLRLVYSTACHGAKEEREGWEGLGVRTLVTHVGINNPTVALPYFLSRWIRGDAVREILGGALREEGLTTRFMRSLPGLEGSYDPELIPGSVPVLSGEGKLTILSGLGQTKLKRPSHLRFSRSTGSSLGLALRAMAGEFRVARDEVDFDLDDLLSELHVPALPFVPSEHFRELRVDPVYRPTIGYGIYPYPAAPTLSAGKIVIELSEGFEVPLEQGFALSVGKTISLTPGRVDPESRVLSLEVRGLWVKRGLLRFRATHAKVQPTKDGESYEVVVGGGAWGVIPFWRALPIGGRRPEAGRELEVLSRRGFVNTLKEEPHD